MILIHPDREALSLAAAELFVREACEAVADRGRFTVLLSGGETPRRTYELLAEPHRREEVPWDRVHLFWGDERCVPHDDPRSNYRMARLALIDHVPVPPSNVHPIACEGGADAGAAWYEAELRAISHGGIPRFDLAFLGIGEDGHTASLFPGSPLLGVTDRLVAVASKADEAIQRVTVTVPVINQAALIVFLVSGEGKAAIVREALAGMREMPARLIHPVDGRLFWLLDEEAVKLVEEDRIRGEGAKL
ncbi:6-phosphogluconolactonase [Geobacter sp.]|uniref:6-phosphogluconolactonase n=1 Tax=Geobacter sp. TaxID=46610 RepID=UPI0026392FED|nr:6-phosphogluconolactonase [Geobacter sp.]